ncbi:MAG: MlaD family protein [Pirellulaceae bacterium]
MNETQLAWRVGIVVICAALILAILVFLFGEGWQSQYTVFVEAPTAPNVTVNTPVRKNGILIGRVSEVENQDRSVLLTLKIRTDEAIYENEIVRIGTASFLGDAVIDVLAGPDPDRGTALTDRMAVATTNVAVERDPLDLIDAALNLERQIEDTLESGQTAGDTVAEAGAQISALTSTIQTAFEDENSDIKEFLSNARQLSVKAETAIENFNQFMVNVNEVVGDPDTRENIRVAIESLPQLLDEINVAVVDAQSTINGFTTVAERADENLSNLTDFTAALGNEGPELIYTLNNSLQRLDSMITDIGSFAEGLGNNQGTLSRLINDPELYDNLNETIRNARDISIQLRPLMNDIRFAVDGVARDPSQVVGLRRAFDRTPAFGMPKGNILELPRVPIQYSTR